MAGKVHVVQRGNVGRQLGKKRFLEGELHAKFVDLKNGCACMASCFGAGCGGEYAL